MYPCVCSIWGKGSATRELPSLHLNGPVVFMAKHCHKEALLPTTNGKEVCLRNAEPKTHLQKEPEKGPKWKANNLFSIFQDFDIWHFDSCQREKQKNKMEVLGTYTESWWARMKFQLLFIKRFHRNSEGYCWDRFNFGSPPMASHLIIYWLVDFLSCGSDFFALLWHMVYDTFKRTAQGMYSSFCEWHRKSSKNTTHLIHALWRRRLLVI